MHPTGGNVGGTALIVVPGVGDDSPGDTVAAMTEALLVELGPRAHAEPFTRSIVVPPLEESGGEPAVHEVSCARIERPGGRPPLVVYEMHWADLSRFPDTLGRFVLTLYGMLFQVSTIGLEALRAETAGTRPVRAILNVFSYLTAVLAVGLTAGAAILGIELAALLRLTGRRWELVIATVALLSAAGLAWYGDRFLRARGWRFSRAPAPGAAGRLEPARPGVAFGAIAAAVGVAPLLVHAGDRSLTLAVHDVLWAEVRWVLPLAWALVGLTALAACAAMAWSARPGAPEGVYAATRTAVISVVVGGLGIALLGALLVAAALAVTTRAVGSGTPVPASAAADVGAAGDRFGDYSLAVFERSLRPLGAALLCALALIVAVVVLAFPYLSALAQRGWRATTPRGPLWAILVGVLAVSQVPALVYADTGVADALAVLLAVLAAALAAAYWAQRFRAGPERAPGRRGLDLLLGRLGSAAYAALLAVALAVAALALVLATPLTEPASDALDALSRSLFGGTARAASGASSPGLGESATVAALVALAALLASRLTLVAKGLDVAYDVATYMRIPHGRPGGDAPVEPPRRRILRRYGALLDQVRRVQRPDRVVIAAHSQGSVYTLTLLLGDAYRDSADRQEAEGWPLAGRVLPDAPEAMRERAPRIAAPLAIVTAGCPLRQTYAPSFPGQYDWATDAPRIAAQLAEVGPGTTWRNLYRSGDYLGRALWTDDLLNPGPRAEPLSEACLGPGQHTGYWRDPGFAREVLALV